MRPLHLLFVLLAVVLVIGCGAERPGGVATGGSAVVAPTTTATPWPAPSPTAGSPTGPLAGFPLDLGYDHENGDDHSPVVVTDRPGLRRLGYCGHLVWDPSAGTTDLIGVEFRGEAEWARGRTLVLYPSAQAAANAIDIARDAVAGCPEQSGEDGYGTAHDLLDSSLGEQSVLWTDTYWSGSDGEHLFDTGLTVYHLVRVDRAVLGSYEYGEGNGADESRAQAVDHASEGDRPVVQRMRDLPSARGPAA